MERRKLWGLLGAFLVVLLLATGTLVLLNQEGGPITRRPTPTPAIDDTPLARVGDQVIGLNFWAEQYVLDQVMSRLAGQPNPDARATLERVINETLLLQAYMPENHPTEAEVETYIETLLAAWDTDEATLLAHLQAAGLTRDHLVQSLRRLLLVSRARALLPTDMEPSAWVNEARETTSIHIDEALFAAIAPPIAPTPASIP